MKISMRDIKSYSGKFPTKREKEVRFLDSLIKKQKLFPKGVEQWEALEYHIEKQRKYINRYFPRNVAKKAAAPKAPPASPAAG